jgi:hypothetical protein
VDDGVARERSGWDAGDLLRAGVGFAVRVDAALDDGDVAVRRDPPDQRDRDAPPVADLAHGRVVLGPASGQHPFLRLRDHHLPGGHAGLAPRDRVKVEEDARAGLVCRLGGSARDAASAQVLDALDQAPIDQLQACLDKQLLRERVADLDRGPLVGVVVLECRRGEDAGPADAVAAGRGSEQDHVVARAGRLGQDQHPLLEQADGHHVDERVALVARVEDELAAHGRDADAVPVAAHAADDAVDEVARARVRRIAKAQRVEHGDRASAHREDVAQDAAHSRRGALVRLDRRRVVVALDLEGHRKSVADTDDSGVVADAGHHAAAARREGLEQRLGALVGAMLAPHHAEHGQLGVVGVAAELLADDVELAVGHPQPAVERLGPRRGRRGRRHVGHARASAFVLGAGRPAASHSFALSTSERISCMPSSLPRISSDMRSG